MDEKKVNDTEEVEVITLTDEDGNEYDFEILAEAEKNGNTYFAVIEVKDEDDKKDDILEYVVLKLTEENGEQVLATIDGFQFVGVVDAENGAVVFDGLEWNDGQDYIINTYTFYYDQAKTQAYGYYAASDAELTTPADLTFSFEGDKLVGLETYFASVIFALEDESFVGYDFFFSPEATLEYTEGAAEPETSAVKASVKGLGAELQFGMEIDMPVASIKVEPYHGKVNRQFVSKAVLGF